MVAMRRAQRKQQTQMNAKPSVGNAPWQDLLKTAQNATGLVTSRNRPFSWMPGFTSSPHQSFLKVIISMFNLIVTDVEVAEL